MEERFNHKIANDALQDGYNLNFRFRYLLNLMVPLNLDFIEPNTLFFAFNDEIHINVGKQITYNLFNQNRLFVGLGYQFKGPEYAGGLYEPVLASSFRKPFQ